MRVLITGSSGTIGTRLCEKLLEAGHEVIGMDWVKNKWNQSIDALTLKVDMRDEAALKNTVSKLKGVEVIVHLAANARVYELVEHPDRARDNFLTAFNALELARAISIKKFVFASSRESYGNIPESQRADRAGLREEMAKIENCESPYTASKIGGEALVHAYARCYGFDTAIFRFSNVYGMYDDSIRVVPLFIRLAGKNEPMTVFGKDKCLDFTYIDDCVAGLMLGLERFDAAKGQTINLATGRGTTILSLAETIRTLMGSTSQIIVGKPRTGEVIRYIADISRAKQLLSYNPKTMFEEGIRKAIKWYAKNT